MGQRNFQGSAVAYDDAYNRSRTGSRAPDALLGLANALTGLNDRNAACATLDKLRREFPTARGPVRETAATLRARNGCG
jgi:TolA-binding protein